MACKFEGWALAGVEEAGSGMPDPARDLYEAVFFDVRHCLEDVEKVVDLVFEPMRHDLPAKAWALAGQAIAYTLGARHFHCWLNRDDISETTAFARRLDRLAAFHGSLEALGLPAETAWSRALCRLIREARRGDIQGDGAGFLNRPDWRGRLERMIADLVHWESVSGAVPTSGAGALPERGFGSLVPNTTT